MKGFFEQVYQTMKMQYKDYFFDKSIYLSLAIWPIFDFIQTYFSFKPFSSSVMMEKLGLKTESGILVYLLLGFVALRCFYTFIQSAWRSSYAMRISGSLELLYMSPANRFAVLLGSSIASFIGSLWMIVVFTIGVLISSPEAILGHIPMMLFGIIILLITAISWGVLLHSLFLFSRDSGFLFTIFQSPLEMFTGARMPFQYMPLWAQTIGALYPATYVIRLIRQVFMYGSTFKVIGTEVLISILMASAMCLLSMVMIKVSEKNAKIYGTATLF